MGGEKGDAYMQLPALIEPLPDRPGYRARLGEPFNLAAEAGPAEEAARQLSAAVDQRLRAGARVVGIPLPGGGTPAPAPGWLPKDDLTREWQQAVEDYRRECDLADRRRVLGESPV